MQVAAFGKKVFSVSSTRVYTPTDISFSGELQTDTQEVDKAKPSTYIKGPGLETMSFTLSLDSGLGVNVRDEIDYWRRVRDSGKPDVFLIGGRPVSNYRWLLTSVEPSEIVIVGAGKYLKAKLSLKFEEYVRPGQKDASKTTSASSKAKAVKSSNTKPSFNPTNSKYDKESKTEKKRSNPNVDKSTAKLVKYLSV